MKLPVDDVMAKCGIAMVPKYRCCTNPKQKIANHCLLPDNLLKRYGINMPMQQDLGPFVQVNQAITKW